MTFSITYLCMPVGPRAQSDLGCWPLTLGDLANQDLGPQAPVPEPHPTSALPSRLDAVLLITSLLLCVTLASSLLSIYPPPPFLNPPFIPEPIFQVPSQDKLFCDLIKAKVNGGLVEEEAVALGSPKPPGCTWVTA